VSAAISTKVLITGVKLAFSGFNKWRKARNAKAEAARRKAQIERESLGVEVLNAPAWKWALKQRKVKEE